VETIRKEINPKKRKQAANDDGGTQVIQKNWGNQNRSQRGGNSCGTCRKKKRKAIVESKLKERTFY